MQIDRAVRTTVGDREDVACSLTSTAGRRYSTFSGGIFWESKAKASKSKNEKKVNSEKVRYEILFKA